VTVERTQQSNICTDPPFIDLRSKTALVNGPSTSRPVPRIEHTLSSLPPLPTQAVQHVCYVRMLCQLRVNVCVMKCSLRHEGMPAPGWYAAKRHAMRCRLLMGSTACHVVVPHRATVLDQH